MGGRRRLRPSASRALPWLPPGHTPEHLAVLTVSDAVPVGANGWGLGGNPQETVGERGGGPVRLRTSPDLGGGARAGSGSGFEQDAGCGSVILFLFFDGRESWVLCGSAVCVAGGRTKAGGENVAPKQCPLFNLFS